MRVVTEFFVPLTGTVGGEVFLDAADDNLDVSADFAWTVRGPDGWVVTAPDGSTTPLTGEMASFTPTMPGTYTVSLTVTDDRGVSQTLTQSVVVAAASVPPTVPPTSPPPAISAVGADPGSPAVVTLTDPATGVVRRITAYEETFLGGVNVATGDVTGDGVADVITGPGVGGGPLVKVFDGATGNLVRAFFAFDVGFRGGVSVAVADVTGDGTPDIVVGAGAGGGPHVKVFDGLTGAEVASFYAYEPGFAGGVSVAAIDLDGDGKAEVLTSPGAGGGPALKVFYGGSLAEAASLFVGDPGDTQGHRVEIARDPDTGRLYLGWRTNGSVTELTDDLTLAGIEAL